MQSAICICCGKEIGKMDGDTTQLSDGGQLCGACAGKARILYPKSFTWVRLKHVDNEDYDYDSPEDDDESLWLDPLSDMRLPDFREALERSEAERAARRRAYGGAKAYFCVDDNHPVIEARSKGKKFATGEYALAGVAALGDVEDGAIITVHRREGDYTVSAKRVEVPHEDSMAGDKADRIPEGCCGWIILDKEAPFIYPGDLLSVE